MTDIPSANVNIVDGGLGAPFASGTDLLAAIGTCSSGTEATPVLVYSVAQAQETFVDGPLVDFVAYYINATKRPGQPGKPVLVCRATTATAGARAAIDVTGVTGTSIVTSSGTPRDTYAIRVRVKDGGTIGTVGITFQVSLDGGRNYGPLRSLGTATSYELTGTGVTLHFSVDEGALITLANELRTDYGAHISNTGGAFHTSPDGTNTISTAAATTLATAITLLNELRTDYSAHRVLTSGTVHGAADSTNVLTAPAATDGLTAYALANDIKAKFNAHRVLTASSVHALADTFNVVAAANAGQGTLLAGDLIAQATTEPLWDDAGVSACMTALRQGTRAFRLVHIVGLSTPSDFEVLEEDLAAMGTAYRYTRALANARDRNSETEVQWISAINTEYAPIQGGRIGCAAGHVRITSPTFPIPRSMPRRPFAWAVAAWAMTADVHVSLAEVARGGLPGVTITDEDGNLEEHDSRITPGLEDGRFIAARLWDARPGVYVTLPLMLSAPGSDFSRLHLGLVMDVFCTTVQRTTEEMLSAGVQLNRSTGFILERQAKKLESKVQSALNVALLQKGRCSSATYTFSRTDALATPGTALTGSGECLPLGYLEAIRSDLAFVNPAIKALQGG